MKKISLFLLLTCVLAFNLHSQAGFQKRYGTDSKEFESLENAVVTPEGGVLLAGYTESGEHGSFDFFLQKLRPDGTEVWMHTYGTAEMDVLTDIVAVTGGGYLISGYSVEAADSSFDAVLTKVNESGEIVWRRTVGEELTELGRSVCQRSDGSIILFGTTVARSYYHEPIVFRSVYNQTGAFSSYLEYINNVEAAVIKSVVTSDNGYLILTREKNAPNENDQILKFGNDHQFQWSKTSAQISAQIGLFNGKISEIKAGSAGLIFTLVAADGVYIAVFDNSAENVQWYKKVANGPLITGTQMFSDGTVEVVILSNDLTIKRIDAGGLLIDSVTTIPPVLQNTAPKFVFRDSSDLYIVGNVRALQNDYMAARVTDLSAPIVAWQQTFGESGLPDRETGICIVATSDGGFISAGNKMNAIGERDLWFFKANAQGDVLWEKTYSISSNPSDVEMSISVELDNSGNIILLGITGVTNLDYHLLKFTSGGDLIFDKTILENQLSYFLSKAIPLPDGGYAVSLVVHDGMGLPTLEPSIFRLNNNGEVIWIKTYSGIFQTLELIPGEGFLIAGQKSVNFIEHPWILETDLDGNMLLERVFPVESHGVLNSVRVASDGSIFAGGFTIDAGTNAFNALVIKMDALGETIWRSEFNKDSATIWEVRAVLPEPDGGVCISAVVGLYSIFTNDVPSNEYRTRLSVARLDATGAMVTEKTFGTDGLFPQWCGASRTSDGDIVVCSTVDSRTALQDAWVIKTNCSESVPVTEQTAGNSLAITPNPVGVAGTMFLNFDSKTGNTVSVSCFDAAGKSIWQKTVPVHAGENRISLNAPRLPGAYTVVVSGLDGGIKTIRTVVH